MNNIENFMNENTDGLCTYSADQSAKGWWFVWQLIPGGSSDGEIFQKRIDESMATTELECWRRAFQSLNAEFVSV